MVNILDCTLRDGGYYTDWDFDKGVVDDYLKAMNALPVRTIEVGYRTPPSARYLGRYGYCPRFELEDLRRKTDRKISVMVNEKEVRAADVPALIGPVADTIDMVRMAVAPDQLARGIRLGEAIRRLGLGVAFNIMYMSRWKEFPQMLALLPELDGVADCVNMVDSYGGIMPDEVRATCELVCSRTSVPVGFHGHNNLELALANTLAAIEGGAEWVDATVLGMGRGPGNLKLELLLTYLGSRRGLDVDFNALGNVVLAFTDLQRRYGWGTGLPYMLSGANSLPQKEVMEWVTNRLVSFNAIVRALENRKQHVEDNDKFPVYRAEPAREVLIVGGGAQIASHIDAIRTLLVASPGTAIVHASSRNAALFEGLPNPQLFCLTGSEGRRLERIFEGTAFHGRCLLPPYPRKMGTEVPATVYDRTAELDRVSFTDLYTDSCTAMALEAAVQMGAERVLMAGYDGYQDVVMTQKERDLTRENEHLFAAFERAFPARLASLTPTLYAALRVESIYSRI